MRLSAWEFRLKIAKKPVLASALAVVMLACAAAQAKVIASPTVTASVKFADDAGDQSPAPADPRPLPPLAGDAQNDFLQAQRLWGNLPETALGSPAPGADPAGDREQSFGLSPILTSAAMENVAQQSPQTVRSDNIDPEVWVLMWGLAGLIILAVVYINRVFRRAGPKRGTRRGRRRRLHADGSHGFAGPSGQFPASEREANEQAGQQAFVFAFIPNGQAGFSLQWQYAKAISGFTGLAGVPDHANQTGPGMLPAHAPRPGPRTSMGFGAGPCLGGNTASGPERARESLKIFAWYELESM